MMSDTPATRLAFLGLGNQPGWEMKHSVRAVPSVQAVAGYDLNPQVASAFEHQYGVPAVGSIPELARAADLFMICTPPTAHADGVDQILAHRDGQPTVILVQKPVAVALHDVHNMQALARQHGAVIAVCLDRRQSAIRWLTRKIRQERLIGTIFKGECRFNRVDGSKGLPRWFLDSALAGGGPGMDLLPHPLDMLLFALGFPEILGVSANTHRRLIPAGASVEDSLEGTFTFLIDTPSQPGTVRFEASWEAAQNEMWMFLQGTEGWASLQLNVNGDDETLVPQIVRRIHGEETVITPENPADTPSLAQCRAAQLTAGASALHALQRGETHTSSRLVTLDQAAAGLQIIRAAYRSAAEGGAQDQTE